MTFWERIAVFFGLIVETKGKHVKVAVTDEALHAKPTTKKKAKKKVVKKPVGKKKVVKKPMKKRVAKKATKKVDTKKK